MKGKVAFLAPVLVLSGFAAPTGVEAPRGQAQVERVEQKAKMELPVAKNLRGAHTFQTFNNCGPASLSMALSHYGISESQEKLGRVLRPYQNPSGDNDDKSVTLAEIAREAEKYGLIAYYRPAGDIEKIKKFIANDIPVITRTLLSEDSDIGHYRLVTGYDASRQVLIQDDSLQGARLEFSYSEFGKLWKRFNYEYLVLIPVGGEEIAKDILDEDIDSANAWRRAVENSRQALARNEEDIYARFNLSVALYNVGDYAGSLGEFEKVENSLPFRTLWYQIEPILAYQKLGNTERVFQITDKILNDGNRAFSELYTLRGEPEKAAIYSSARVPSL